MEDDNFSQDFSQILSRLKPHMIPISIACIGLLLIGYGLITSWMPKPEKDDITFEASDSIGEKKSTDSVENKTIMVDVEGGVQTPGVYRLSENARVQDAVLAAGGFSDEADTEAIQRLLNLAVKVTDGAKIYIPRLGEQQASENTQGASTLISINIASASELDILPGIGTVTAEKIITNRPYTSLDELVSKKAVGKATFEKIKDKITL